MFLHKHTIPISASTAAGTAAFSTVLSGLVYALRFINSTSLALSTARTINVGRESSGDRILTVAVPSSNLNFYPRNRVHGTTGNLLSSTVFRECFPLCRERIKVSVNAASSAGSVSGSVVAYIAGD